ncbi:MAG: TatD family hydrolase [Archaeoglobaceae archaeon]|nr:TatD family hydrolase [Archaeoglobaceae archaeon]MCX7999867.1 TatD family hydrolase [Leptospiraceae bacterium]MDW7989609.1 TatD family hydrolase [Archaeoglobaceae archaeon]
MFFDSHVHTEGLGISELKKMKESGIEKVCSLSFYPIKPYFPQTLIDGFRKLEEFESRRCEILGIQMFPGVGIHPRCIPPNYMTVVEHLEAGEWVLFGELGIEKANEEEREVFVSQIRVAMKKDIPCVIHTPRENKRIITSKILEILENISFPPELAVVDHVNFENLDLVFEKNYWIGLTVQSGKLSPQEVVKIVKEYGSDRFLVNSDSGYRNEFLNAVAETAKILENEAKKVCLRNAERFLGV